MEAELTNKLHQTAMKFDQKIQDNARDIRNINQKIDKQSEVVSKLELELNKQKRCGSLSIGDQKCKAAQDDKFYRARRSFRIWPISMKADEQIEICIRRFFIINMGIPAALARDSEIEKIKKAVPGNQRSPIHDEYIVTFTDTEARDTIKLYTRGLANYQGNAGLRLELTDRLKGSH